MQKSFVPFLIMFCVAAVLASVFLFVMNDDKAKQIDSMSLTLTRADKAIGDLQRLAGIGSLGSTHIHADVAMYVNSEKIDFSKATYQLAHSYAHFEDGRGDVVHMHATGITLAEIFNTVNIRLTNQCITYHANTYCNDDKNSLKILVNGQYEKDGPIYVFKDLDRILISYGPEDQKQLLAQMDSVTHNAEAVGKGINT